jgi:hypothetical protein
MKKTNAACIRRTVNAILIIGKRENLYPTDMSNKEKFFRNLSEEKKKALLAHFTALDKTQHKRLSDYERRIIYLAWLWKNGLVTKRENGYYAFDEDKAGVSLREYEDIPFRESIFYPYSYNLESIHTQYNLSRLMAIL